MMVVDGERFIWIIRIMMVHEDTLKSAGIYNTIWAFKDNLELANREVTRAIIECFWPKTNTFVTPNRELRFSLMEMKKIIGPLILGEIYEEYIPTEGELETEFEEFGALFLQVVCFFEYLEEGRDGPKTHERYREWFNGIEGRSDLFKGDGFFRKVQKAEAITNYPSSFDK